MYIVSECLLGANCKYNGGHNLTPAVVEFLRDKEYITICPETMGGLKAPRPPAEIQADGSIIDREGTDVTAAFRNGAAAALAKIDRMLCSTDSGTDRASECGTAADADACSAEGEGAHAGSGADAGSYKELTAILKANSPSCGCGLIYDGTFSGKLVEGDGITAAELRKRGCTLMTEKDF